MSKRTYEEQIHIDGRVWGAIAAVAIVAFPLVVALIFGLNPDWYAIRDPCFRWHRSSGRLVLSRC